MSIDLLQPPSHIPPAEALLLSQQAPQFFKSTAPSILPYPLSLLTSSESPSQWTTHETLLLACLRTGDDKTAHLCLSRLISRFGETNERVQALTGLYQEATAVDDKALEEILKGYERIIEESPTNFPIRKRKVALLKSMGRSAEAIKSLSELLNSSPIDAEAWAELSQLYFEERLYSQSMYCLEEVLLITPNAWNIHARLGEVTYVSALVPDLDQGETLRLLTASTRHFCRSIELCNDYLRGFYGLKLSTGRTLNTLNTIKTTQAASKQPPKASSDLPGDLAPPTRETVERLNELATGKLAEIVRRGSSGEKGWDGYRKEEIEGARELLGRDGQGLTR